MYHLDNIYIDKNCKDSEIAKNIASSEYIAKIIYVDSPEEAITDTFKSEDSISNGKKNLLVTENKGSFLKKCPGTKEMICCNYYFLNFATNCPIDCSYCIMQEYLANNPILKIFSNVDAILKELENLLKKNPLKYFRIGTGELSDSLAFDYLTGFSKTIVPFFAKMGNAVLELKTKTDEINNLIGLEHGGRTVVAWSVNPENIIDTEELYSASLEKRIEASVKCQKNGYKIAFHFDPIILYEGWEEDYAEVIKIIFKEVNTKAISWISLGGLRFSSTMKSIINERFKESNILCGEMVSCSDRKMRYFKPLRVEAFRKMVSSIKKYDNDIPVYLCMESKNVWEKVFGKTPDRIKNLDPVFKF